MHLVIFFDSIETNKEVQSLFNQGEEWDEECNKRTWAKKIIILKTDKSQSLSDSAKSLRTKKIDLIN